MVWIKDPVRHFLDGEKGKTMFHRPMQDILSVADWNREVPAFFKRVEKAGDDRSYAILSALLVEHHLDRLLGLVIPGYKEFRERKEMSFSMKLDLLKSMELIPEHILTCADAVRDARNNFAHNLDLESIDGLEQSTKDRVKGAYDSTPVRISSKERSQKELFHDIVFVAVSGIRSYEFNVKLMMSVVRSQEFLLELERIAKEREGILLDQITKSDSSPTKETFASDKSATP